MQGADFHLNQWLMTSRTPVRRANHTTESADAGSRAQRIIGTKGVANQSRMVKLLIEYGSSGCTPSIHDLI